MAQKEIKITKDDQEGFCMPSALAAWERNGWTRADDGSSENEAEVVTKHPAEAQQAETKNKEG